MIYFKIRKRVKKAILLYNVHIKYNVHHHRLEQLKYGISSMIFSLQIIERDTFERFTQSIWGQK